MNQSDQKYKDRFLKLQEELKKNQKKFNDFKLLCPHPEDEIKTDEWYMRPSGDSGPQVRRRQWCGICLTYLGPMEIKHIPWDD